MFSYFKVSQIASPSLGRENLVRTKKKVEIGSQPLPGAF
jgi:hypothetical protein